MKPVGHMHLHSEYSIGDSLIRIEQLPELVERFNISNIALTDHGTVDGCVKFYQTVKQTKAAPILGCEFYIVDDFKIKEDKKRYHLVALAKSRKGFNSIMKALTVANMEGFYYRPRIDWKYVLDNMEDVVVLTACEAGVLSHPEWDIIVPQLMEKFKDDFYWEAILLVDYPPQKAINENIKLVSAELGGKIVFTNDVHYIGKKDWKAREVVRAINIHGRLDPYAKDPDVISDLQLKTYDDMIGCAKKFGWTESECTEIVKSWDEIADKCKWDFSPLSVSVPAAYKESVDDPKGYLHQICYEILATIPKLADDDKVLERVERELREICDLGFAEYFLLVREMIHWAKQNGCRVGPGRGSAGGSIVAFILGITEVNPMDYDLVFERFISPGRHDLPDIDTDYEDTERVRVIEHLREKYGSDKVAYVSTFSDSRGRGSVRDVGRVFDVPLIEIDKIAKTILTRSGGDQRASFTIEDTVQVFEKAKDFNKKYPYVIQVAKVIEGLVKSKGVHAAGLVVDTDDLYSGEKCVLVHNKDGELVVNWDKKDLEYMGMMKIDMLGLKTLNILSLASEAIKLRHNTDVVYEDIPFDDKPTLDLFNKADTIGAFQFGSAGMIQYLKEFKPVNFTELYQINALWRPGTLRSGLTTEFILLRDGKKQPEYISESTKAILQETLGIVLFQEQIMHILNKLGDMPWRTTDMIRKVVSKSEGQEKFESFRKQFVEGAKRLNSMSKDEADKIFSLMKYFGCLTGDTKIYRCSSNQHKDSEMTIEEAYKYQDNYNFQSRGLKILSMHADGFVHYNTIKQIWKTGVKPVYLIRTSSNKTIRATAEHVFLINDLWAAVKSAHVGDRIKVSDLKLPRKLYGEGYGSVPCGQSCPRFRKGLGPTNERSARHRELMLQYIGRCQVCGSDRFPEMHHLDGDEDNDSDKNTTLLCRKHHRAYTDKKLFKRYRVGYYTQDEEIVEIKLIGDRETYDMEMVEEPSNFIANNFVSHNSYGFNKCVALDTKILVPAEDQRSSERITIEEAYEQGVKTVYGYNSRTKKSERVPIKEIVKTGIKPVCTVICETGKVRKIRTTLEHKFLTQEGWRRLSGLFAGDKVLVNEPWEWAEIKYISQPVMQETYDIHVDSEEHNYIADMFVVHNSHSVEYTVLGFWTMFLKSHYPVEFFWASLVRNSDNDDLVGLLADAGRHGIAVSLPHVNKSGADWIIEDDKKVRAGLNVIKGVSDRVAEEIMHAREKAGGEFKDFWHFRTSVTKKIVNVDKIKTLLQANAFIEMMEERLRRRLLFYIEKNKAVPDELGDLVDVPEDAEPQNIDSVFSFDMAEDLFNSSKKLIALLTEHLAVKKLKVVADSLGQYSLPLTWYIGKFDEIKYGYRSKITKDGESRGFANDLGGVYGVFRDDTFASYSVVAGELYKSAKKGMIEDAGGKPLLVQADKVRKAGGSVYIHKAYEISALKAGEFDDLDMSGIVGGNDNGNALRDEIKKCSACPARKDCKAPVPFSAGELTVAIIGEAPGAEEDTAGQPFIGRSGQTLWKLMKGFDLDRSLFHVTNVLKCRPVDNKITDLAVVDKCADAWLKREMAELKPRLILSLGKSALRVLSGDSKAGIMDRSGSVVWSEKWTSWIVWGIHPAMLLYSSENEPMLRKAIESFNEMLKRLL